MPFHPSTIFPLYARFGVKVGIACCMAYGISYIVGLPYALWAVVATVVAMQLNVADSLQAGIVRLTGTVFGAAIGVGLILVLPSSPLLIGIAIFVTTTTCGFLTRYSNRYNSISIATVVVLLAGSQFVTAGSDATVTFSVVGAEHIAEGTEAAISFGLLRVVEICIGVGCAFLVSVILWPVRLVDTLRTDLGLQFHECARLLDQLLKAFLTDQQPLPFSLLDNVEASLWDNHERLGKARKHESMLYSYDHGVMNIQVKTLVRTTESLRTMMEALNDYDEGRRDVPATAELRALGDVIMATLRHFGGDNPAAPAPDLVRGLTNGVAETEIRLSHLRSAGAMRSFDLHKVLQFFSFYQGMRVLCESLLLSLDKLQRTPSGREKITNFLASK